MASFQFSGEDGEDEGNDGDYCAGDGELAVAKTGGEHHAAEGGSHGVAEVEGSLVESSSEVGGLSGVVDDAGLERCAGSELNGSPDEYGGDGGDEEGFGEVKDSEGDDE